MRRRWLTLGLIGLVVVLVLSCSLEGALGGPEPAAREAFEQWAQENGVPYKNVRLETIEYDGTFATVRVTAKFRESPDAPWLEQEADVQCRKVGGEWQAEPLMHFELTEEAQATAIAAIQATPTAWTPPASRTVTATVTPTPTLIPPQMHQVQAGEMLIAIAEMYDTTVEEILALNPGLDPDLFQEGQLLPRRPAAAAAVPCSFGWRSPESCSQYDSDAPNGSETNLPQTTQKCSAGERVHPDTTRTFRFPRYDTNGWLALITPCT